MIDSFLPTRSIASPRRRSEQPTLWILLLAGSVLLHVVLFLSLRPLWTEQASSGQGGEGAIAIDLVDSPPAPGKTPSAPAASTKAAIAPPAAIAPTPTPEKDSIVQAPARSPQNPKPKPSPIASSQPEPAPSARSAPTTASPTTSSQTEPAQPAQPTLPDRNPAPSSPAPSPPILAPKPSPPPATGPVRSGVSLPPPSQISQEINTGRPSVPGTPPISNAPTPNTVPPGNSSKIGLSLTIVGAPRQKNLGDPNEEPAILLSSKVLQFPQQSLVPCIQSNIGQLLTLRLVIDKTGKSREESFIRGRSCDVIAKLIRENIRFSLARQSSLSIKPTESQVEIDLQIQAL